MTFVLKRRPQSSIKTGITWKALLKLHLYFRIPFQMHIHVYVKTERYMIFETCLVLSHTLMLNFLQPASIFSSNKI